VKGMIRGGSFIVIIVAPTVARCDLVVFIYFFCGLCLVRSLELGGYYPIVDNF
jgi:hypothetical protein